MLREINRANRAGQHRGSRYRIYSFHEYLPKFDPRKKVRNGFPPKQREGSFSASIIKISTSNSEILRVFWPSWRRDSKIERHPFSGSFHVDLGTCYIVQVHVVDISCHKCGHHHRHKRNQHHCLGKAGFKYNFFTFCFMADQPTTPRWNSRPYDQGFWKTLGFPPIRPKIKPLFLKGGYVRGKGWLTSHYFLGLGFTAVGLQYAMVTQTWPTKKNSGFLRSYRSYRSNIYFFELDNDYPPEV